MPDGLYEADFFLWTQQQARLLRDGARAGMNLPLDWEHLAEEIESVGRSDRRELRSRLRVLIEHLVKLGHSSASGPRPGWIETIQEQRDAIADLLGDSPSLRSDVGPAAAAVGPRATQRAAAAMRRHGEAEAADRAEAAPATYTDDQLLGDWLPEPPAG